MFDNYKKYLEYLNEFLKTRFDAQKEYIYCHEGCSMCCECGTYPMSKMEFEYLKYGFSLLNEDLKTLIKNNIKELKQEELNNKTDNYMYKCPFLVNKSCQLYEYRALVCRSFGLLIYEQSKDGSYHYKAPCCIDTLNYSEIYDAEKGMIDFSLAKENMPEPNAYNIGLNVLKNNQNCKDIDFGDSKTLLDWIKSFDL